MYIMQSHRYVLQLAGGCRVTVSMVQVAGQASLTLALVQRVLETCVGTSLASTARSDAGPAPLCTGWGYFSLPLSGGIFCLTRAQINCCTPYKLWLPELLCLHQGFFLWSMGPSRALWSSLSSAGLSVAPSASRRMQEKCEDGTFSCCANALKP